MPKSSYRSCARLVMIRLSLHNITRWRNQGKGRNVERTPPFVTLLCGFAPSRLKTLCIIQMCVAFVASCYCSGVRVAHAHANHEKDLDNRIQCVNYWLYLLKRFLKSAQVHYSKNPYFWSTTNNIFLYDRHLKLRILIVVELTLKRFFADSNWLRIRIRRKKKQLNNLEHPSSLKLTFLNCDRNDLPLRTKSFPFVRFTIF